MENIQSLTQIDGFYTLISIKEAHLLVGNVTRLRNVYCLSTMLIDFTPSSSTKTMHSGSPLDLHYISYIPLSTCLFAKNQRQKRRFIYTGITSAFWLSSQVKVRPSMYVGRRQHGQRQPVETGSEGGTIMSTLSSRRTTPITLTVLPSFIYLQNQMYSHLFPHVFKSKTQFFGY